MNQSERDIQRKLRILGHAEQIGDVSKTCRYFGTVKASIAGEQPCNCTAKPAWQTASPRRADGGARQDGASAG